MPLLDPLTRLVNPYQRAVRGNPLPFGKDPLFSAVTPGDRGSAQSMLQGMGGVPSGPQGNPNDVVAMGRQMASQMGWSGDQWDALYQLWNRESGWNPQADNPSSSAFGIPQAMTSVHQPGKAYMSGDPGAQISWGLSYIADRYKDPLSAWAHSQKTGWY